MENLLAEELREKKNGKNDRLVDQLIADLEEGNLRKPDELVAVQDEWPASMTFQLCLQEIDGAADEYAGRTEAEVGELRRERALIGDTVSPEGIRHLICYCALAGRHIPFPFFAYRMVMNGEL